MTEFGRRPSENVRTPPSRWVADTLPSLTQRVRELEARLSSMQADLDAERSRLRAYVELDPDVNDGAVDASRSADAIRSRARDEANEILERATDQRRVLLREMDRLRAEHDELLEEIASVRGVGSTPAAFAPDDLRPESDLQAAVAAEMRAILAQMLQQVRAQKATPPGAAAIPAEIDVSTPEPSEPIVDEFVEELHRTAPPLSPPTNEVGLEGPVETAQELVEHVEDLLRPEPSEPIIDEFVEELGRPAPPPPPSSNEIGLEGPVETAQELVEHIEELRRPELAAPILDEYVEDLRRPDSTEPIVDGELEGLRASGAESTPTLRADSAPLPAPDADVPPLSEEPIEQVTDADPPVVISQLEGLSFFADESISDPRGAALESTEAPPADEPSTSEALVDAAGSHPIVETNALSDIADAVAPHLVAKPASAPEAPSAEPAIGESLGIRQIEVVIAPVGSFLQLIEIQRRIQSLSSVEALHLGDFRDGVAAFAVNLAEAISPKEFGAAIQMLEDLHLRVEGTSRNSVELRAGEPSVAKTAGRSASVGLDFSGTYGRPLRPRRRRLSIRFGRRRPREG